MKTFLMTMTVVATLTILCVRPVLAQIDSGDPALAPGEPMDSEPAPMSGGYTPVHPVNPAEPWMEPPESRFSQPFVNPAFPAAGQMRELPPIGMPHGGFYRPVR